MGKPKAVVSFSPRSLVGMSQSARKRAWVAGKFYRLLYPYSAYSWSEIRLTRPFLGQRLRPCPGCLECEPKDCDGCGFSLGSGEDCEVCDAHAVDRYVMGCDGSGVLPAKRSAGGGR